MTKPRPALKAVTGGSREALARLQQRGGKAALHATPSLSEKAYQALRRALQEGVLEPNTHLTEVDLAAWLQMSRTPVREAMRRLESEGVLRNEPFRGATVVTLDEKDVRELFAVRELLEVAAAGWCAVQASDAEISTLRAIVETEAAQMDDPRALFDLNRQLHQEICNGAHNAFLSKALAAVQSSFTLLGKSNLLDKERARASHREHLAILAAVEKRDRAGAESAARAHVQTSLRQRLKRLAAQLSSKA
jgi:DNA-binding GntR family transcriptional regulator